MKRRWNLAIEAGLIVSAGAFLSYFLYFVRFPNLRDFPWVNLPLFVPAMILTGLGVWRAYRQPERYHGKVRAPLLGFFSVAICAFFLFDVFYMAKQLPPAAHAPAVGQAAPDFTLLDATGKPVSLAQLHKDQRVLLVFYRGYW